MASTKAVGQYLRGEKIGHGNFGVVYKGVDTRTSRVVAIKTLDLDTVNDEVESVQHEVALLSHLSSAESSNVTKYYGTILEGSKLWIIMDLCSGGSVRTLLKGGLLEDKFLSVIFRELSIAVAAIHKEGIIHRDIKAANVLITLAGQVKLCDFGVAAQLSLMNRTKRTTIVGTPYWMAPEVIVEGRSYNNKADIWSMGITLYEMVTGNPPYSEHEAMRALMMISNSRPPRLEGPKYTPILKDLVALCLDEDPDARPSADELLKHKFVKTYSKIHTSALKTVVDRYVVWKSKNQNHRDSLLMFNPHENNEIEDDNDEDDNDSVWDFNVEDVPQGQDVVTIEPDDLNEAPDSLRELFGVPARQDNDQDVIAPPRLLRRALTYNQGPGSSPNLHAPMPTAAAVVANGGGREHLVAMPNAMPLRDAAVELQTPAAIPGGGGRLPGAGGAHSQSHPHLPQSLGRPPIPPQMQGQAPAQTHPMVPPQLQTGSHFLHAEGTQPAAQFYFPALAQAPAQELQAAQMTQPPTVGSVASSPAHSRMDSGGSHSSGTHSSGTHSLGTHSSGTGAGTGMQSAPGAPATIAVAAAAAAAAAAPQRAQLTRVPTAISSAARSRSTTVSATPGLQPGWTGRRGRGGSESAPSTDAQDTQALTTAQLQAYAQQQVSDQRRPRGNSDSTTHEASLSEPLSPRGSTPPRSSVDTDASSPNSPSPAVSSPSPSPSPKRAPPILTRRHGSKEHNARVALPRLQMPPRSGAKPLPLMTAPAGPERTQQQGQMFASAVAASRKKPNGWVSEFPPMPKVDSNMLLDSTPDDLAAEQLLELLVGFKTAVTSIASQLSEL